MDNEILVSILSIVISVFVSGVVSIIVVIINNRNNDKNKLRERGYELTKEIVAELRQILNKLENVGETEDDKNADFNNKVVKSLIVMYDRSFKLMSCIDKIKFDLIPFFDENYYNDLCNRLKDLKHKWQILYVSGFASKDLSTKSQMEEILKNLNAELITPDEVKDKMQEYIDSVKEFVDKIKIDIEKKLKMYINS